MNSKISNVSYLNKMNDFVNNNYLLWCKWLGTFATILGALATSAGFDPFNIVAFTIGSVFWLLAAIRMKDSALMAVNAGLLGIYLLGAIVRFF